VDIMEFTEFKKRIADIFGKPNAFVFTPEEEYQLKELCDKFNEFIEDAYDEGFDEGYKMGKLNAEATY